MRRLLQIAVFTFLTFAFIVNTNEVQAQEIRGFNKGKIVPQLGFGLGAYGYGPGFIGGRFMIPVVLGVEGGVHDYVGVGGYFGVGTRAYNNRNERYTALSGGVRGTFHFYNMIEDLTGAELYTDKLDIYVGLLLGYERYIWSDNAISSFNGRFFGGGIVGIRYYPTNVFGIYAELGRNVLSYVNLGVTFRLGRKN